VTPSTRPWLHDRSPVGVRRRRWRRRSSVRRRGGFRPGGRGARRRKRRVRRRGEVWPVRTSRLAEARWWPSSVDDAAAASAGVEMGDLARRARGLARTDRRFGAREHGRVEAARAQADSSDETRVSPGVTSLVTELIPFRHHLIFVLLHLISLPTQQI